jgi:hypothetical protein
MSTEQYSVYFDTYWTDTSTFLDKVKKQTPNNSGEWENIKGVLNPAEADYHITFDKPTDQVTPQKAFQFRAEPPCISQADTHTNNDFLRSYSFESHHKPQRWFIQKTYDDLINMEPTEKSKDLSWITTDKGRDLLSGLKPIRRFLLDRNIRRHKKKDHFFFPGLFFITSKYRILDVPTDGHILRMDFLEHLQQNLTGEFDLYGRGSFSGPEYKGSIEDKWTGLAPYRYSIAVENYTGKNYFSEKLTDALLAWCMPIYWGCTNLSEFLPENSFVEIDIENPNIHKQIREVISSNRREENIEAIAEARRRLLNEYQIWPTVQNHIMDV